MCFYHASLLCASITYVCGIIHKFIGIFLLAFKRVWTGASYRPCWSVTPFFARISLQSSDQYHLYCLQGSRIIYPRYVVNSNSFSSVCSAFGTNKSKWLASQTPPSTKLPSRNINERWRKKGIWTIYRAMYRQDTVLGQVKEYCIVHMRHLVFFLGELTIGKNRNECIPEQCISKISK